MTLGQRAWEIEWATGVTMADDGSFQPDLRSYKTRVFTTRKVAQQNARKVYPQAPAGFVRITEVELVDLYGDKIPSTYTWEAVGESDYYEGE